jgi:replication initiation protein RepC
MQTGHAFTTPFGRRLLSLGMLATQANASEINPELSINKWKLFRSLCEARTMLGVSDRSLVVLNALLTFYPETELSEANGLVVFPSNAQLSLRAHGMAPATLRRHLSALVESGLIFRKDSPNGKRYSRRAKSAGEGRVGEAGEAFGFNIAPLISRASEFEAMAEEVQYERRELKMMKERVSLLRRDIDKLIELGAEELPHEDWSAKYAKFRGVIDAIPRQARRGDLEPIVDGLECIQIDISKLLENKLNSRKIDANESHFERHIHNSNTQSISDLEPCFRINQGGEGEVVLETIQLATNCDEEGGGAAYMPNATVLRAEPDNSTEKPIPLGLVLKACPDIADYAKGGIASWRDLMVAAVTVRSILGVSPSAYKEACEVFGQEKAAVIVGLILQRAELIQSAGGYLRGLTEKQKVGEFSIWPMLLAQLRVNGGHMRLVETQ